MIVILFVLTFLAGLMFGYMIFHKNLRDITFEFKKENRTYILKYHKRVIEMWDGETKYDYIELKEL